MRWLALVSLAAPAHWTWGSEVMPFDGKSRHWAFLPLREVVVPPVKNSWWARTPVDSFIHAALEPRGLSPSPPADPATLIRRISFDMIGLPPAPEEVKTFRDASARDAPAALEALVDRMLASRHYGERWGRHWLDVARYADSDGHESDIDRPNAYHFRDFVIRALNEDLPFDTFVRWQLAGDEYEPDNPLAVSATGFLTAGPSIKLDVPMQDEKLRTRYNELDDILATIGTGFLGVTLACARCHDHKYDPIPARDYYRILCAVHGGDRAEVMLGPRAAVADYQRRRPEWERELKTTAADLDGWLAGEKRKLEPALRRSKVTSLAISNADKTALENHPESNEAKALATKHRDALALRDDDFRRAMDGDQRDRWDQLSALVASVRAREPKPLPRALAFRDHGADPAPTWLFRRGDYYDHSEPVQLGFLTVLTPGKTADEFWQNARVERPLEGSSYQRKALAEWIADPRHGAGALLARVIVNRVWQHHFGEGLVRTVSDFGRNGEPPTHPELLEWLARDFVAHGWKLKRLHRMILTSSVYLQDKSSDAMQAKSDPDNRLLSRRRPQRIESEILRDSILAISGLLNLAPFGPSFKPPISSEAMVARNVKSPYPTDIQESAATRRRSIYLFHKRVIPYPLMQAFDAPDAQQSCGRRNGTTVAPQALVLLNDQVIRDSALAFADRLSRDAGRSASAIVDRAYELALGRQPRDSERAASLRFLEGQCEARRTRDPIKPLEDAQRRSLADFCQSLFSLNEFVYVD